MDEPDDKVGYKNPPKHTRFKKGQSGNPKGRPKRQQKTILEVLGEEMNRLVTITENGVKKTVTREQVLIRSAMAVGAKGNAKVSLEMLKMWWAIREKYAPQELPAQLQLYKIGFEGGAEEDMTEVWGPAPPPGWRNPSDGG